MRSSFIKYERVNFMKHYEVTLTKAVRVGGKRREAGAVVEVDERTFAELKYHHAFEQATEVKSDAKTPEDKTQDDKTPATLLEALPEYKNIKADDIKEQLTLREIPFDTNDKTELYELLKTAMENGKSESGE